MEFYGCLLLNDVFAVCCYYCRTNLCCRIFQRASVCCKFHTAYGQRWSNVILLLHLSKSLYIYRHEEFGNGKDDNDVLIFLDALFVIYTEVIY